MKQETKNKQKQLNSYIKYSGLGFQMIAAILIGAWLGAKLDDYMGNQQPIMTLVLMLLGVTAAIVLFIRGLRDPKV